MRFLFKRYANEKNSKFYYFFAANDRFIPRGSCMAIPISAVGKNPLFFDDPEDFKPERFLDEQTMEKRNAFSYIPFSAGPRNCIGMPQ